MYTFINEGLAPLMYITHLFRRKFKEGLNLDLYQTFGKRKFKQYLHGVLSDTGTGLLPVFKFRGSGTHGLDEELEV